MFFLRGRLRVSAAVLAALMSLAPFCRPSSLSSAEPVEPPRPPNLLFLLTDDQRWDAVGYAGNPLVRTPALDSLARAGVVFRNAYVTTSICAVSRATLLSGQWARRHGIHDFGGSFSEAAFRQTYPALLREAGYRTGFVGKYGVGSDMPAEAFDYWAGFEGQGAYEQTDSLGRPIHLTRVMGEQAIAFLRTHPPDRPFALSVSFKAPHVQDGDPRQFIYDPADSALYADVTIPPPTTAAPAYWEALPDFFRASNEARERWKVRFSTPERFQEMVKGYYRLITGVDREVAAMAAELRRRGLHDNTVIVFTSDNGFFLGEHGLAGKWYGYEESVRVPFFVYDPRRAPRERGIVREEVVLNADVAPTLLALAGVPVPAGMQGESLVPLLGREERAWRSDFFYEHLFRRGASAPAIPPSEGVLGGRYKYLRYIDEEPPFEQLFDLARDPHETIDLAGDPAHAERLARLRARWETLRTAAE